MSEHAQNESILARGTRHSESGPVAESIQKFTSNSQDDLTAEIPISTRIKEKPSAWKETEGR